MKISRTAVGAALLLLAGCATAPVPPLPVTHPASHDAPEGPAAPPTFASEDAATQRTNQLLKP